MERQNQKLSALITTLLLSFSANAQVVYYSTDYGAPLGQSVTLGNTTYFQGPYGENLGQATVLAPMPTWVPMASQGYVLPPVAAPLSIAPTPILPPMPMGVKR